MAPFSDSEIQNLQLTTHFSGQSHSIASSSLRTFVETAVQLRNENPDVVPEKLSDGGPPMAEFDAGIVFKTSA